MKKIFFVFLIIFNTFCYADWQGYDHVEDTIFYYDKNFQRSGDIVFVRQRVVFGENSEFAKENIRSSEQFLKLNCKENSAQTLNAKIYSDNQWQELSKETDQPGRIMDIKSNPMISRLFNLTCVKSIAKQITNEKMVKFFKNNRVGDSPDYAVVKNGNDVLMVITGMMDDKAVCEDMIRPYNEDPSLSDIPGQYACVKVND